LYAGSSFRPNFRWRSNAKETVFIHIHIHIYIYI
jgi:hypothetical protein